jgi:hypothetical protein
MQDTFSNALSAAISKHMPLSATSLMSQMLGIQMHAILHQIPLKLSVNGSKIKKRSVITSTLGRTRCGR